MRNLVRQHGQGRAVLVLLLMAFAAPWCAICLSTVRIQADSDGWLAATDPNTRLENWHNEQFPTPDVLIATWRGSTADDPRIDRFVAELTGRIDPDGVRRGGVPQVAAVTTPRTRFEQLAAEGVTTEAAVTSLTGTLIGRGGLKLVLTDAGKRAGPEVFDLLVERAREELGLELIVVPPVTLWTGETTDSAAEREPLLQLPDYHAEITWRGYDAQSPQVAQVRDLALHLSDYPTAAEPEGRRLIRECFTAPGSPVAVAIELSESGTADIEAAAAAIRQAALTAGVMADEFHLSGAPLIAAELDRTIDQAIWNSSAPIWKLNRKSVLLLAVVAAAVATLAVVRSIPLTAAIFGCSLFSAVLTACLITLTSDAVSPVVTALPLYVFGLVLLWALRTEAVQRHANAGLSTHHASSRRALRLAGIAATLVMAPWAFSSTPAVRLLGIYGLAGNLIAFGTCRFVLPTLSQWARSSSRRPSPDRSGWANYGALLAARPAWVMAAGCALLLSGAVGLSRAQLETRIVRDLSPDSPRIEDARYVDENLTGNSQLDVVVRFSTDAQQRFRFLERLEIIRDAEAAVRAHPAVSGTVSLADWLPEQELPAADVSRRERVVFNRHSNAVEDRIREGELPAAKSLIAISKTAQDWLADGDQRLSRAGDEHWRIAASIPLIADHDAERLTRELDGAVQAVLRQYPGVDHVITGKAISASVVQTKFQRSLSKRSILVFLALFGVLVWMLKGPSAAVLGLTVNVLPILAVLGAAAWRGVRLDSAALIAAMLTVAWGTFSSVHLLAWFRDGLLEGDSRDGAGRAALASSGRPVWQAGLILGATLLSLTASDFGLISRFGGILAGMTAAVAFAQLVILPAMLFGPLGALLERSLFRSKSGAAHRKNQEESSPHVRFDSQPGQLIRPAV